jgi:aspartate/methionine/tyrosine aminotransferase
MSRSAGDKILSKLSERVLSIERSPLYAIMELAKGMKDVIRLNIGEPDFKTPQHIIDAAKEALDAGFTHYAPDRGDPELRALIAEQLKKELNLSYDPEEEILITAGSQAGLFVAIMSLVNPGDEVIVFAPYYPPYIVDIKLAGGKPIVINLSEQTDFHPTLEALENKVTNKTKLMIVHSPNNPTGAVYDEKSLKALTDVAISRDLLVVSDEAYWKIIYDGAKHRSIASLPGMWERTIVVNSFSKTYAMTGWRVGFLAANKDFIIQMLKLHHSINICANAAAQRAAVRALTASQECVQEFLEEYDRRRRFVVDALNKIPGFKCKMPEGTFYVFVNIQELGLPSLELARQLVTEAKVITVPGSGFGSEGYLRISFSRPIDTLREAVERIHTFVEKTFKRG